MSLFSSIQLGANSLSAAQIGLQVAGNNIANANTPGYLRERVILTPAPTQRLGSLLLGLGVQVDAIVQQVDHFLEDRLRDANSDLANGETQENTYLQLEALIGELNDTDLSTSLSDFFGSLNDILNQPESVSVRNLAVLQGETLSAAIQRLDARARKIQGDTNQRIIGLAGEINSLTEEIADLNVKVVTTEGGSTSHSDAVGLRDQRLLALEKLAKLVDIRAIEQPSGSVTITLGSDLIVFEGTSREVQAVTTGESEATAKVEIRLVETDAPLATNSGELAGLLASRDDILQGFLDRLDDFSQTLAFEFNKVFSGGQGLSGFDEIRSEHGVSDVEAALDAANLPFTPVNGSFQVRTVNDNTGLVQTSDVFVNLDGLDEDTSLTDLAAALNAIDGLEAEIDTSNRLTIRSESPLVTFSFADDSSGVLASLGINTFFSGTQASDLGVNAVLKADPGKFAASQGGVGSDAFNAELLADFSSRNLELQGGDSISVLYDRLVGDTVQAAAVTRATANGFRVFQQTLQGQKLATSGVNLDEEAVNMITYQRAYQASARFITTVSDLLEILVNL